MPLVQGFVLSESVSPAFSRTPLTPAQVSLEFCMLGVSAFWFDIRSEGSSLISALDRVPTVPFRWELWVPNCGSALVGSNYLCLFQCVMPCVGFLVAEPFSTSLHFRIESVCCTHTNNNINSGLWSFQMISRRLVKREVVSSFNLSYFVIHPLQLKLARKIIQLLKGIGANRWILSGGIFVPNSHILAAASSSKGFFFFFYPN